MFYFLIYLLFYCLFTFRVGVYQQAKNSQL